MSDTLANVHALLSEGGYSMGTIRLADYPTTIFENESVLGFVLHYPDAQRLIQGWSADSARVLQSAQLSLRRAEAKAWNAYFVLLADMPGDYGQNIALGAIEENLVGTRKIARAGVSSSDDLRAALLPLLPIQSAPRLEAVDMPSEIRLRTSELHSDLVEAFLSGLPDGTLSQLLESQQ